MPNVCVEVRIKPSTKNILEFNNNKVVVGSKIFTFSKIHCKTTQLGLFSMSIMPFLEKFLSGGDCSILVYGQTGSGKTYTMGLSHQYEQGIIQNTLEIIYKRGICLTCSFIEIYNEEIYDLMSETRIPLNLRQSINGISIVGLTETLANSFEEAIAILKKGSENRTTKSTKMNSESSRSHAMFSISMCQNINNKVVQSTLTFVDLAGSERLKRSECIGKAAKEAISINCGLLSLGNVISALYMKKQHIPYRDSKLTRILQKCLADNVLLIACVSGMQEDAFETTNTLKYASRAALISLNEKVHVENDKDKLVILNLKKEISSLKDENNRLRILAMSEGFKKEHIRGHPLVVELINRLKIYEGEDAVKKLIENACKAPEIVSDGNVFVNECVQSNIKKIEKPPMKNFTMPPRSESRGIEKAIEMLKEKSAERIKDNKLGDLNVLEFNKRPEQPGNSTKFKNYASPLISSLLPNLSLFEKFKTAAAQKKVEKIQELKEVKNDIISEIQDENAKESEIVAEENIENLPIHQKTIFQESEISTKRKRLVTFDLEPKHKNNIFTPLREISRTKLTLIDTINDYNAISLIKHDNKLFFNCIDSKIRFYDGTVGIAVSDDSIRCMSSSTDLFYSSRSLLKVLNSQGRTHPVFAYKNEISTLKIIENFVFTGHEDGTLSVLDLRSNEMIFAEKIHKSAIFDICFIEDSIYTCSRDHSVKYSQIDQGCRPGSFITLSPPHYDTVSCLLSFKGKCVSMGRDSSIKVWNHDTTYKTVPYAHDSWIKSSIALDNLFVTGCKNGILKCWNFIDQSIRCVGKVDIGSSINCMTEFNGDVWISCQNKKIQRYSLH